jgi:hypothetical protein
VNCDRLPLTQPLRVIAHFDDGSSRDVTPLATFSVTDPEALSVDHDGRLCIERGGIHAAIVKFLSHVHVIPLTAPLGHTQSTPVTTESNNLVDRHVDGALNQLRLSPRPVVDDGAFLRRVYLDLTGRLPTPASVHQFAADSSATKRADCIDQLLASPEFTTYWTYQLGQLLRIRAPGGDTVAASTFQQWLEQQVAADTGWRVMVEQMLLAEGDSHVVGPATFYRLCSDPFQQAEYVSEVFLGLQMRCANCHDHPLDRWTQDDYHGLAQIFAGIRHERVVQWADGGEVLHPATGKPAVASVPLIGPVSTEDVSPRVLAAWILHPQNPFFARAFAGRIWRATMGRGLVDPPDDLRLTNPGTHPQLLEELAAFCATSHFQLRPILREICLSDAYARQTSTRAEPTDLRYYAAAMRRPLDAVILADAIADVTGVGFELPEAQRFQELVDLAAAQAFLEPLGGCAASLAKPAERLAGGLAAELHLLNGPLLNDRLTSAGGTLTKLLAAQKSDEEILRHFYLHALAREPSAEERTWWLDQLTDETDADRTARLEDFVWALLTSEEFTSNH